MNDDDDERWQKNKNMKVKRAVLLLSMLRAYGNDENHLFTRKVNNKNQMLLA